MADTWVGHYGGARSPGKEHPVLSIDIFFRDAAAKGEGEL
jgi:hypothetical protein